MRPPAWVLRLARDGSVPRSQVTNDSVWVLEQTTALGLTVEEVQGSRRRVVARDPAALERWLGDTYPPSVETSLPGRRAGNIARARRSKLGVSAHDAQSLLLRWFDPDSSALLAELTDRFGLVGLSTDRMAELPLPAAWTLLTIENWEPFLAADYRGCTDAVVVVYTGGNIAGAILHGLMNLPPPQRAIHFGDYDWAGLAIYRRLRAAIPSMQLYLPDDIERLFAQFADPAVLLGQEPILARDDDPPSLRNVVELIAQHNAGLEQEIVPLPRLL